MLRLLLLLATTPAVRPSPEDDRAADAGVASEEKGVSEMGSKGKPWALALHSMAMLDRAEDKLYDAGFRGGDHYEASPVRVESLMMPGIRSTNDDREVLGDIAKQLVIVGISFRLVTVK